MAPLLGIELGPVSCRILDLDTPAGPANPGVSCVRSFNRYPRFGHELREALDALRGRTAVLVAWGLEGTHARIEVACGPYAQMRREASTKCARPGRRRDLVDIAPAGAVSDDARSRPVVLLAAPAAAADAAMRPFAAAGLHVRSVLTPAAALMSAARTRGAKPGALEVYVALSETTTAVALVRDGALISAHETPWGYLDPDRRLLVRRKSEVAAYLGAHLESFLRNVRPEHGTVSAIYICGGFPGLRSMTISLIECLDLEVDPLDSLFGIDTEQLPEDGLEVRERASELRLAWAAACDWPAPLDLLRDRRQQRQRAWMSRAAVAAGMATGLGLGVVVSGGGLAAIPVSAASAVISREAVASAPAGPDVPAVESAERPAPSGEPAIAAARFVHSYEPPPDAVFSASRTEPPAPSAKAPVAAPRAAASPAAGSPPPARPAVLPFAGTLQSILYGPERRLAVIDGRILQPGDEIRGARIVEISPTAVLVRDGSGRQAELHVGKGR
jgi:hypothetical protein